MHGVRLIKAHTLCRKRVKVRRNGIGVAVAPKVGADVLCGEYGDVFSGQYS
jgi:hypothetical protein